MVDESGTRPVPVDWNGAGVFCFLTFTVYAETVYSFLMNF